ncbi:MAG: hypothetical protein RLZZ366_1452 [Pseudomonadota bacterium]|jgi:hypothetical protein
MRYGRTLLLAFAFLSGCVGPPNNAPRSHSGPMRPPSMDLKQCLGGLTSLSARYTLVPAQNYGGGCSTISSIQLTSVGIPVSNIKAIQCPLAKALTLWAQGPMQAAARQWFGSSVVKLESMGAYACRNVIGRPQAAGQRSEHATANAVDIGGFVLADGRRVTVASGWHGSDEEQGFLRDIRAAGCKRFQTVLSPDYNGAHWDHLHFDMGRGPFCR